jgi:septal ring factor EnvC (AmiA/AmiB activator)
MGTPTFTNYLASIQANIGSLNDTVDSLEKRTRTLTRRVEAGGDDAQKSAGELAETQDQLAKTVTKIDALKAFFVDVKKRWSKLKDRVIGYIVWAPPIGVGVPPHRYTRDLCVIKLDKKKFRKFRGNALSLGAC